MDQLTLEHEIDNIAKIVMIALGSNAPGEGETAVSIVSKAMDRLDGGPFKLISKSRLFLTPCFPAGAGPDYVNACAVVQSALDADGVLKYLHEVEKEFGRVREKRWESRSLDLDILNFGSDIRPSTEIFSYWMNLAEEDQHEMAPETLVLPHPRLHERAFVLIPLLDIAPDWVHPVMGKSVQEMVAELPDAEKSEVRAISGAD